MSYKHIRHTASLLLTALLLLAASSCADEIAVPDGMLPQPEGEEATVTLRMNAGDMASLSRATGRDYLVTSIWIGLFNATTGELKDYYIAEGFDKNTPADVWQNVSLKTTSGATRVAGVANFENYTAVEGDKTLPMRDALLAVTDWDSYRTIAAAVSDPDIAWIDEPLNSMLMSGLYSEQYKDGETHDGTAPVETILNIPPTAGKAPFQPTGAIHLRRLLSHSTFNVTYNASNIKSFDITEWRVYNVPTTSWLHGRSAADDSVNAGETVTVKGKAVSNSTDQTRVTASGNTLSFDFWNAENLHTGLTPPDGYSAALGNLYHYREKQHKNPDGTNSGKFISLASSAAESSYRDNATYVTFTAEMEMGVDENGKALPSGTTRNVQATYTVHLGYCVGENAVDRARDFNCFRNTKYSYNITVNNIADLLLETTKDELVPSVEGIITDVTDTYVQLDAHYNSFNIYLTAAELQNFKFYMEVYGENGQRILYNTGNYPRSTDSDFRFFSWIELRKTSGQNVLAEYKPRTGTYSDGKTYLLSEINSSLSAGWYTLFVNEYCYERYDDSNGDIYDDDKYAWHWFANAPDRKVWINVDVGQSADGASIHNKSKYALSQHSIQTYYRNGMENAALGLEHVNENQGLNLRSTFEDTSVDMQTSGRYSVAHYYMNTKNSYSTWYDNTYKWSDFLDLTTPQNVNAINGVQGLTAPARTYPIPATVSLSDQTQKNYYPTEYDPDQSSSAKFIEAINACTNRNRDLDGDGRIDHTEVRWFVPSTSQMMRVILGRQALSTPVMDYDGISKLEYTINETNSRLLIFTADRMILWAMEGLSISSYDQLLGWGGSPPWQVRCVRYLGAHLEAFRKDTRVQPVYRRRTGTNIFDLDRMDYNALRSEPFTSSSNTMPPHFINDQRNNRCYHAFEVSDKVIYLSDIIKDTNSFSWAQYLLDGNNPCASLDTATKKGWRVPNQKEASIFSIETNEFYTGLSVQALLTCTFTYYDVNGNGAGSPTAAVVPGQYKELKVNVGNGWMTQNPMIHNISDYYNYAVRCVRDVVE